MLIEIISGLAIALGAIYILAPRAIIEKYFPQVISSLSDNYLYALGGVLVLAGGYGIYSAGALNL